MVFYVLFISERWVGEVSWMVRISVVVFVVVFDWLFVEYDFLGVDSCWLLVCG